VGRLKNVERNTSTGGDHLGGTEQERGNLQSTSQENKEKTGSCMGQKKSGYKEREKFGQRKYSGERRREGGDRSPKRSWQVCKKCLKKKGLKTTGRKETIIRKKKAHRKGRDNYDRRSSTQRQKKK